MPREMDKQDCPHCGKKDVTYMDSHLKKCEAAPSLDPSPSSKEEIGSSPSPDAEPSASPSILDFPELKQKTPAKPKGKGKKVAAAKNSGILGFANCFMIIKDWINSFWDYPNGDGPFIKLDETTAQRLEMQFNEAFGIQFSPIAAFCISMFFVFGLPILVHVLGKDTVGKWMMKAKDKIMKRFAKDDTATT